MFGVNGSRSLSDVWTFDLANQQWSEVPIWLLGPWPGGLHGAAAAYDAKHDRVLLFGGNSGTAVNQDTWTLDLNINLLTHLTYTSQYYPRKRWFASAFYDTTRDEMMLFSGTPEGVSHFCCAYFDAWSFHMPDSRSVTSTEWQFPAQLPLPNSNGCGGFDPETRQLVMAGGATEDGGHLPRGWLMNVDDAVPEWRPYGVGLNRNGLGGAYDPADKRLLMFGGSAGSVRMSDLWQLQLRPPPPTQPQVRINPMGTPPDPRFLHAACFDAENHRMYVFGGAASWATNAGLFGDLWQLDLADTPTWTRVRESPLYPEQRSAHAALYDALRDRMLVFGGTTQDSAVWALNFSPDLHWTRLPTQGVSPGWRMGPGFVYDSRRDRAILVGGSRGRGLAMKDVWALTLGDKPAWTPIAPLDSLLEGGENASTAYDSLHDAVVTFGGDATTDLQRFEFPRYRAGAFRLSLEDPTWRSLAIVGGPRGHRTNQASVFDPVHGRIVSFGGLDDYLGSASAESGGQSPVMRCDTWSIALDDTAFSYTPLDSCSGPGPLFSPTAVIDPSVERILMYGGNSFVWARPLLEPGPWTLVTTAGAPPEARLEHSAVVDTRRHRLLVFGGTSRSNDRFDVWQFALDAPSPIEPRPTPSGFALAVTPTPSIGVVTLGFTLPDAQPARVEIFDLSGRRVALREVGSLGPGQHALRMTETARLSPGVYLLRMSHGNQVQRSRIVLIR